MLRDTGPPVFYGSDRRLVCRPISTWFLVLVSQHAGYSGVGQPLVSRGRVQTSSRRAVICGQVPRGANLSCFQTQTAGLLLPAVVITLLIYIISGYNSHTQKRLTLNIAGWISVMVELWELLVFISLVSMQHWCLEICQMLA